MSVLQMGWILCISHAYTVFTYTCEQYTCIYIYTYIYIGTNLYISRYMYIIIIYKYRISYKPCMCICICMCMYSLWLLLRLTPVLGSFAWRERPPRNWLLQAMVGGKDKCNNLSSFSCKIRTVKLYYMYTCRYVYTYIIYIYNIHIHIYDIIYTSCFQTYISNSFPILFLIRNNMGNYELQRSF